MMQKNISVKTLGGAQKNMVLFSSVMVLVNFLFLLLGGVLYLYASNKGLLVKGDDLFPTIALSHMPMWISLIFIIGLISALFPSADGAITALTSSFCIDILGIQRNKNLSEAQQAKTRKIVHLSFALVFLIMVYYFKVLNNKSIIGILLDVAGYTYGPLLGLFAFGILSKHKVNDHLAPIVCIVAPILCYGFQNYIPAYLGWTYQIGIELLVLNGALTFFGLWLIRKKELIS
jgi:Na+/proline symporter